MQLPLRMQAVQTPVIPVVAELIRQYPGTISLGQGVIGYPPPQSALAEVNSFLSDPQNHKYKPVQGIPALLELLAAKLKAENRIWIDQSNAVVVTVAGCRPVLVPTNDHFQLQLDRIAEAITPRTRAISTISPNNPTGAVYSE